QCSEETACCSSNEKICVAKKYEELTLWFNVRYVGSTGYESFKVQNHTECECVYKNRQSTMQMRQAETEKRLRTLPYTTTRRPKPLKCKCPTFFDVEITDGMCGCFCKDKKFECRKRYEGREGFTLSDQRCIIHKICEKPHCLYPPGYSTDIGRCPDRHEKIRRGFLRSK
ncbi:CLUMA_CG020924, isoform A, partial [Clunio marinus]